MEAMAEKLSQNVLEIKAGDKFGMFEVKEANEDYLLLYNKDKSINLDQNTVQALYGDLKFKVADSSTTLRFYPFVENTIQATPQAELKAASTAATPAIIQTASATQVSNSVQTAAPTAVQAATSVEQSGNAPIKKQWYWVLFAIAGLLTAGYLVLRRD